MLLAYERDALGTRCLLDALVEADGRANAPVDPSRAEDIAGALSRTLASDLAALLQRLANNHLDQREAALTADELDRLVPLAQATARTLRARVQQPR